MVFELAPTIISDRSNPLGWPSEFLQRKDRTQEIPLGVPIFHWKSIMIPVTVIQEAAPRVLPLSCHCYISCRIANSPVYMEMPRLSLPAMHREGSPAGTALSGSFSQHTEGRGRVA